jgi:hypothetical protein
MHLAGGPSSTSIIFVEFFHAETFEQELFVFQLTIPSSS